MKSSGSPPQSPNPETVIPLQTQANKDTFDYMLGQQRVNQISPYGSQTWEKTPTFDQAGYDAALQKWQQGGGAGSQGTWIPGTDATTRYENDNEITVPGTEGHWSGATQGNPMGAPNKADFTTADWTYRQTLSPDQQKLYDANMASQLQQSKLLDSAVGRVGSSLSQPLDLTKAPGLANPWGKIEGYSDRLGGMDPYQFYQKGADAAYRQQTRYLDPQVARQQDQLRSQLADQGFVPGTPGYEQAMTAFQDANNRQYAQARDSAITTGANLGSTAYGNQINSTQGAVAALLSGAGFNNQARQQAISDLLLSRQQPLNELNALRTGTQVQLPNNPAQYQTPNLQPVDVSGIYQQDYNNQLGNYNAQVGQTNSANNLLGTLGTAAATFFGGPGAGLGASSLFSGLGNSQILPQNGYTFSGMTPRFGG